MLGESSNLLPNLGSRLRYSVPIPRKPCRGVNLSSSCTNCVPQELSPGLNRLLIADLPYRDPLFRSSKARRNSLCTLWI